MGGRSGGKALPESGHKVDTQGILAPLNISIERIIAEVARVGISDIRELVDERPVLLKAC